MLYFDIGAYVGDKTDEYVAMGAQVVAVEPNPESYATLVKRFQGNPQVITVNKAVSNFIGMADLSVPGANLITLCTLDPVNWFTGRFAGLRTEKTYRVEVTTLDRLINDYGLPDYVKIDCEGAEEKIITHLTTKIPAIKFEYRSDRLESVRVCLDHLKTFGPYHCYYSLGDRWTSPLIRYTQLILSLQGMVQLEPDSWGDICVCYDEG